jgi:hypothetical protein
MFEKVQMTKKLSYNLRYIIPPFLCRDFTTNHFSLSEKFPVDNCYKNKSKNILINTRSFMSRQVLTLKRVEDASNLISNRRYNIYIWMYSSKYFLFIVCYYFQHWKKCYQKLFITCISSIFFKNMFASILMLRFSIKIEIHNALTDEWFLTCLPLCTSACTSWQKCCALLIVNHNFQRH